MCKDLAILNQNITVVLQFVIGDNTFKLNRESHKATAFTKAHPPAPAPAAGPGLEQEPPVALQLSPVISWPASGVSSVIFPACSHACQDGKYRSIAACFLRAPDGERKTV